MTREIPEPDWKIMQRLKQTLMDRVCESYLTQVSNASGKPGVGAHQRFLDVYQLIQTRDEEFGLAFNDWRRSRAFERLAHLRRRKFITQEEFAQFTSETRAVIDMLLGAGA